MVVQQQFVNLKTVIKFTTLWLSTAVATNTTWMGSNEAKPSTSNWKFKHMENKSLKTCLLVWIYTIQIVMRYQIWILLWTSKCLQSINITDKWHWIVQWMDKSITITKQLWVKLNWWEDRHRNRCYSLKMLETTESDRKVVNRMEWWLKTKTNELRLIES